MAQRVFCIVLAWAALSPLRVLADATVTATGYAFCYDGTTQTSYPMEGIRVELMDSDCNGSEICDDRMGTAYVRPDGSFTVTGSGGDPFGGDPDVYVRFAYNDDHGVRLTNEVDATRSWNTPEHDHNNFGGGKIDFGSWTTGQGAGNGEGTHCGVWRQGRLAFQDYAQHMGTNPPAGHLDIEYWSAIYAGTPWTNTDTIHWPVHFGSWALSHEFGHSVRHAADGDGAHFTYDVTRFAYARSHMACAADGNRNGGESDTSLRGYAFNEGWAEYWANDTRCADNSTSTDFREGAIASHLHDLEALNHRTRNDMVAVLTANPGKIHSLGEYVGRFDALYGVKSSQSALTAIPNKSLDIKVQTAAERAQLIDAELAQINQLSAVLRRRIAIYRQQATLAPPGACRFCKAAFNDIVGPDLLTGQGRALQVYAAALSRARSPEWAAQLDAGRASGRLEAVLIEYRAGLRRDLLKTQTDAVAQAQLDLRAARARFSPAGFDAASSTLAKAQSRLARLATAEGQRDVEALRLLPQLQFADDLGVPKPGARPAPAYPSHASISLPATTLWAPTSITLAKDQPFEVRATGVWSNSGPPSKTADGFVNYKYPGTLAPNADLASLIGKVGDQVIPLGANFSGRSPASGELFISINDTPQSFGDNQGALLVTVEKH